MFKQYTEYYRKQLNEFFGDTDVIGTVIIMILFAVIGGFGLFLAGLLIYALWLENIYFVITPVLLVFVMYTLACWIKNI